MPKLHLIPSFSDRALRWILAGPAAALISILTMAALPMVLPTGAAGVNHLVLPVVLFPLIWSVLIVLPVISQAPRKMAAMYSALTALSIVIILLSFLL